MGLAAELGYHHRAGNPVHRGLRALAGTRAGGWAFSHSLRHLDDAVGTVTRGRHSAPGLLAGLAVLDLTTTGRRSGQPRTSHLLAVPYGDTLALIGTNFGQSGTPAWVLNLEADPAATVSYRGTTRAVSARLATPEEADGIFASAGELYPGYLAYRRRLAGRRDVRVFVLEPAR